MEDERALLDLPIEPQETELCAKLQWCTNNIVTPNEGPCVAEFSAWGVRLVGAETIGAVFFAVFDDDALARRFIVFRGYVSGKKLPTPCPTLVQIEGATHLVNSQPWTAWCEARPAIEAYLQHADRLIVVTGYSVGSACAVLTTVCTRRVARVHLFSPFPFSDVQLVERMEVPYTQIWMRGDLLVWFYYPVFRIGSRNRSCRRAYKSFWTVFGYHNSKTIALSVSGCSATLQGEMESLLQTKWQKKASPPA